MDGFKKLSYICEVEKELKMVSLKSTDTVRISGDMVIIPEVEYKKLLIAKQNDDYRKKLERSVDESEHGKVIIKSLEELRAMEV